MGWEEDCHERESERQPNSRVNPTEHGQSRETVTDWLVNREQTTGATVPRFGRSRAVVGDTTTAEQSLSQNAEHIFHYFQSQQAPIETANSSS